MFMMQVSNDLNKDVYIYIHQTKMQSIFFLKNFVYNSNLTVHAISFTLEKRKSVNFFKID